MTDPIDQAIAAAETPAPRVGVRVRLSTGRDVALNAPADMSGQEALDLIGYIASQLPGELAKHQANARPRPRIYVPAGTQLPGG